MIEFACHCGFGFSVADDMAGALVQCPKCKRLNDVPLLSDLQDLEDGGIYKIEQPVQPPLRTVQQLHRVFTREHFDETGGEIDLRPTMDDVMRAGSEEVPLELADQVRPGAPKYDPFTGELIRPIDVKGDDRAQLPINPANIPVAKAAINYASSDLTRRAGFATALARLLLPANIVVMLFILLGHLLFQGMWVTVWMGFFFIFLAPLLLFMVLVAHYANVIDDIGPGDKDDIPAPLRNVSLGDDVWRPFTQVAGSLMICYVPALIVERWLNLLPATMAMVGIGSIFIPAVLLTTVTSGSALNLRPDRVLGVMRVLGGRYAVAVAAYVAAASVYAAGMRVADHFAGMLFNSSQLGLGGLGIGTSYLILAGGIYLMHAFCYYMGLLYRTEHMNFPWVLQRHVPTRLMERTRPPGGHLPPLPAAPAPARPTARPRG